MNTQLWAWQHNGKTEYGTQVLINGEGVYLRISADCCRHFFEVTNLRKVKVVDEDAIVLDPHLLVKGLTDGEFDTYVLKTKPKPVTEPKNFGTIVEAQVMINQVYPAWIPPHPKPPVETNYSKPVRWLRNPATDLWSSEPCDHLRISYTRKWEELHNPAIISEGVEG